VSGTTFRTSDGTHYLTAELDGTVVATRPEAHAWETWAVTFLDDARTRASLCSAHGKYLTAEVDGTVSANRAEVHAWEEWRVEHHEGRVAFLGAHGMYLVAEEGGGGAVHANREACGPWETFAPDPPLVVDPIRPPTGGGGPPGTHVDPLVGRVRVIGRSFGDDRGPRLLHGCSDFAALVKYHENRDRCLRELDTVAASGRHYIRVLFRLNGWLWTDSGLTVDPSRDPWYDEALRGYLTACRDRGLRVNLTSGDMNNWTDAQADDAFRRTAEIAASVGPEVVWLFATCNEMRGVWEPGETDEHVARGEDLLELVARILPAALLSNSDPGSQDRDGMRRLSGGPSTVALIHDVRHGAHDACRRAFNTIYENYPGKPVCQDEPTGPNGSPPPSPFARKVYQPTDDPAALLAIYTLHILTGQASTYFNDPALVSREPLDSTWGFYELPVAWQRMGVPHDLGQGQLKPGHHGDAPLQVVGSNALRADSAVIRNYALGVISGGSNWQVRAGRGGTCTIYGPYGVIHESQVTVGSIIPASGPAPTVVRIVG
jgi:hypothetical protein